MRQKQLPQLLARDIGKIAGNTKFKVTLPCHLVHPGLCAERDFWCLPQAKATAKAAFSYFENQPRGSFHHVLFVSDGFACSSWLQLCHVRGSGPMMDMIADAELTDDRVVVKILESQSARVSESQ